MKIHHTILGLSLGSLVAGAIILSKAMTPTPPVITDVSYQGVSMVLPPSGYGVTNPDITQANIKDNICNKNWSTKSIRPPVSFTNKLKAFQLGIDNKNNTGVAVSVYKILPADDRDLSHYEEDHLISLELGGAPSNPNNLWPQPYTLLVNGENLGAREKDRAEGYLHTQVCNGSMTLVEAQTTIKTNWVKVYHTMQMVKSSKNLGSVEDNISTSDDE